MKTWNLIDRTRTADGKTFSLREHDGSYYIDVDGQPLMSTRQHASEEKLAELACAHIRGMGGARVLIGGLGFGYTLRAALGALAPDATVVVAEILGAVIEWNRNRTFPTASDTLADRRVSVVQGDAGETIRAARGEFDAIVLDVDNGPEAMSAGGNQMLYEDAGLRGIRRALRAGGCVAIWSAAPDRAFGDRMRRAGFAVEAHRSRARGKAGATHTIFVGRAPASQGRPVAALERFNK